MDLKQVSISQIQIKPNINKLQNIKFQPKQQIFLHWRLKKRGCEWPEGHPDEAEFHFCGKERFEDKPYCLDHCAMAYIIPDKEEAESQQINDKLSR